MSEPDRLEEVDQRLYWSASKLTTIFECGKKFEWDYKLHTPKKRKAPLWFGSDVHKCLERMHKESIWEDGAVQRLWADTWTESIAKIDWDDEYITPRVYRNRGLKMLEQYSEAHRDDEIVELERKFKFKAEVAWGGIIDKVKVRNGRLAIVDYKTTKYAPDPFVLRADHQLTIYYMASSHLFGEPVTQLAIHNLLDGKEYWTTRTDEDIDLLMESVHEAQKRIKYSMFARNIGYNCKNCSFKEICLGGIPSLTRELSLVAPLDESGDA